MQHIHLQYEEKVNDSDYINACYENAQKKNFMELDILYTKSKALPIMLTDFPSLICYSTLPGSLESYMYVNSLTLNSEKINRSVKTHEAFITLYALNSLRRLKVPNFEYYHAVIENKFDEEETCENFFVLSEFYENESFPTKTLYDILCEDTYENILSYYVSILFALQTANEELSYTHYNLTPESIVMRYVSDKTFVCEYILNNCIYWLNLYKYVPIIINNDRAYVKVKADEYMRSFGYNDVNEIPFENKGIYTDRGFVITDAYRLLVHMLKITQKYNKIAYESLLKIYEYFSSKLPLENFSEYISEEKDYLPYCDRTSLLSIPELLEFIFQNENSHSTSSLLSQGNKNELALRSIGYELKLRPKNIAYYSVKNVIQLYDFLKFYANFINDENVSLINDLIEKGVQYYIEYFEEKNIEQAIEEKNNLKRNLSIVANSNKKYQDFLNLNSNLLKLRKYSESFSTYINTLQNLFKDWSKIKIYYKIFNFLSYSNIEYENLFREYELMIQKYTKMYKNYMNSLLEIRNFFRSNLDLYAIYKNQILFLETLE